MGDLAMNVTSFRRHLRAQNVSPNTVLAYVGAVEQFADYFVANGMPADVAKIRGQHVEAFPRFIRGAVAGPAGPGPLDDQHPAMDRETGARVGHENLLVVKTSDISTQPGGSRYQVSRRVTNLLAGYI